MNHLGCYQCTALLRRNRANETLAVLQNFRPDDNIMSMIINRIDIANENLIFLFESKGPTVFK